MLTKFKSSPMDKVDYETYETDQTYDNMEDNAEEKKVIFYFCVQL